MKNMETFALKLLALDGTTPCNVRLLLLSWSSESSQPPCRSGRTKKYARKQSASYNTTKLLKSRPWRGAQIESQLYLERSKVVYLASMLAHPGKTGTPKKITTNACLCHIILDLTNTSSQCFVLRNSMYVSHIFRLLSEMLHPTPVIWLTF